MISQALPARGFPLFAGIRLPPVNQGTVGSENDRNFPTQRNLLEGGPINQAGKKNSNDAKAAVYTATWAMSLI